MAKAEQLTPKKVGKYHNRLFHQWTDDELTDLADDLYEYFKTDCNYYMGDFFNDEKRLISRQDISNFRKRHEYFDAMYRKCKEIQERKIWKLSIQSDKPTAWIFALKNVAGWRDNPETTDNDDNQQAEIVIDDPQNTKV